MSKEKYNELIRFNIQPGDFIMSGAGTIGRISMVPDGIKKGVFNQALIRFKVDKNSVNPLYFLKFMQSDMMQKQLTQANPGSAMTNLVPMDELKKWDVTIPSLEEQNKISNFINQIDESITLHQGDPIILYGRLYTNYETTIRNVDTFVELKDKSVISQGDEVIVPASGETVEDISRASVVKDQGVIIGGDLNVIKVNHLLDPTFLALTISNGEQQKELSKRAQGKSVVHLHNSDLQEVNLTFPLLNEQKEISTLFEKMDSIITLHQ
ncbi:MAG: restriction endonuclease subunit S, partial [Veillonella sp.]|nr:restriction endonuclease subunit S [Veillonella sp.]